MTIAVNTRFLLPRRLEGIGWYTYELLKAMVAQHPEDEFLFFFDRAYSEEFIFAPNVKAISLAPPARHPVLWYLWFEWSLAKALRKYRPDVFLSPDGYTCINSKVKTVMVTHDIAHMHYPEQVSYLTRKYYKYYVPRFLERADKVVTVSEYTKQDILRHYPQVASVKVHRIYNGCRSDFVPLSENEKAKVRKQYAGGEEYFFYVGAIQPRKNVHRLIAAFDLFKKQTKSSMKLLIGGRFAWKTGAVQDAYQSAQYHSDIQFLGYLSNEELARLMAATYALTYVSLFEGFGLPLVEAMNCEVPILTSCSSSLPEVAGKAGLIIDPTDVQSIANGLELLYRDKEMCNELVAHGKKEKERFSWDKAAEEIYDLFARR